MSDHGRSTATQQREPAGVAAQTLAAIDAYVDRQRRRLNIPGISLAIVAGGRSVHARGFGQARPHGEAPTPQTQFGIGSLTKSFTALAILQLNEAGQLTLDAPVQRYLPWFQVAERRAAASITVRHLLNQTSGLPTVAGELILTDFDQRAGAAERQARELAAVKLAAPVGARWEYSNSNYQLLGLIVEAVSGAPFAAYLQRRILTPLGLGHTYTSPAAIRPSEMAVGHQLWFGVPVPAPDMPWPAGALAGGGLVSNAEDLARYMIALLQDGRLGPAQIATRQSIETMQTGAAEIRSHGLALGHYGMGWCIDQRGPTKLVWHSGTLPHFGAFMALLPERRQGVVLLFNACHHWYNPVLTEFGLGVTAHLAQQAPAPMPVVGLIPWLLRSQALLPVVQLAGLVAAGRQTPPRGRQREQPGRGVGAGACQHLLPLAARLWPALLLAPSLSRRRDYLKYYLPDFAWVAKLCGGLAVLGSIRPTGRLLRALKEGRGPNHEPSC